MAAERAAARWPALLVCAAACIAYGNSFAAVPQFDDYAAVLGDPATASFRAWWEAMPAIRPLLKLSYTTDLAMGGVLALRIVNLLLHGSNALLFFAVVRRLFPLRQATGALAGALLFAVHPAHSEAVLLLAARSVLLMTFFCLLAMLAWQHARTGWSLVAFMAAVACRETAVALPALLTLLAVWIGGGASPGVTAVRWRRAVHDTRWHWALLVPAVALVVMVPRYRALLAFSFDLRDPLSNLVTQAGGWSWMLRQWLWPFDLNADPRLAVFEGWTFAWASHVVVWAVGLTVAVGRMTRHTSLAMGILWFVVALLPAHSLVARLDVANERELYVAGMMLCVAAAAGWLWCRERWQMAASVGGPIMVAALLVATVARTAAYVSETAYWSDVLSHDQANARAWNNLGYALEHESSRDADAAEAYARAIRLDPENYKAYFNLKALCARIARPVDACAALQAPGASGGAVP